MTVKGSDCIFGLRRIADRTGWSHVAGDDGAGQVFLLGGSDGEPVFGP
jgi:hypothetical protein